LRGLTQVYGFAAELKAKYGKAAKVGQAAHAERVSTLACASNKRLGLVRC
jgi:hypothetical protein